MSDYEITIRARNARILRLIRAQGFETVAEFCRAKNLGYQAIANLVSGLKPAINQNTWTRPAKDLADALDTAPETLFTARQAAGRIKAVTREVSESELVALTEAPRAAALIEYDPERKVADDERNAALQAAIAELTPREQAIIKARFGLDGPPRILDDIAKEFESSRDRIRQVEQKALRKLRARAGEHDGPLRPFAREPI